MKYAQKIEIKFTLNIELTEIQRQSIFNEATIKVPFYDPNKRDIEFKYIDENINSDVNLYLKFKLQQIIDENYKGAKELLKEYLNKHK